MIAMRALLAVALASLTIVLAGCGDASSTGSASAGNLGTDAAQLGALASKFDQGSGDYTVQKVGGWSVVADSDDAFAAVRAAQSGHSLGDASAYTAAQSQVVGSAIVRAYLASGAFSALAKKMP